MKTIVAPKKTGGPESLARAAVAESYRRLREKGLLGKHNDDAPIELSVRVPGFEKFALLRKGEGRLSRKIKPDDVQIVDFADANESFHAALYQLRPDVGAVVRYHPEWGGALGALPEAMPGIFDEQVRQMGRRVEHLAFANRRFDARAQKQLASGANVFLLHVSERAGEVLALGMTRERAVFNCELLEKCAKAYVLARATGLRVRRVPWFVRFIANRRLLKDEQRSAESYARGEIPTGFTAY